MNKMYFSALVLFLLLFFRVSAAHADFILPPNIQVIGEESFYNTAAENVVLPEKLEEIGARAFEDMKRLESIYIPEATTRIGEGILDGTSDVVVYGYANSYAERWAGKQGLTFVRIEIPGIIEEKKNRLFPARTKQFTDVSADSDSDILIRLTASQNDEIRYKASRRETEVFAIDYDFP